MASTEIQALLGQTLIDFSINGAFPGEESISAATIEASALPAALVALSDAKAELEVGRTPALQLFSVLLSNPSRFSNALTNYSVERG
jgi:hypothetical protein